MYQCNVAQDQHSGDQVPAGGVWEGQDGEQKQGLNSKDKQGLKGFKGPKGQGWTERT